MKSEEGNVAAAFVIIVDSVVEAESSAAVSSFLLLADSRALVCAWLQLVLLLVN